MLHNSSTPSSVNEANAMMNKAEELAQEKEKLLELFTHNETTFKTADENNRKEISLLKDKLTKTLETKNELESKLANIETEYKKAEQAVTGLRQRVQSLMKEHIEEIKEKEDELKNLKLVTIELQATISKLENSNQEEKEDLEKQRHLLQNDTLKLQNQLKSLKDELRVSEERLKLKDEEIFEIKENFEKQIDELTSHSEKYTEDPICIIPAESSSPRPHPTKKVLQNLPSSLRLQALQDKVHNLTDKLFDAKDLLLEKEAELNALKDDLSRKTVMETNLLHEMELLKEHKKAVLEELERVIRDKEEVNKQRIELEKGLKRENDVLKGEMKEGEKKIGLLKGQIEYKLGKEN
jgi:chromosome segregation ATPase